MIKRHWMLPLLLGLLALTLGVTFWLKPKSPPAPSIRPLSPLSPEAITHIRINNAFTAPFILERAGDGWSMTQPYRIDANTPRIRILLDILKLPSHKRFPVQQGNLATYRLQEPLAVLQLNSTELQFGGIDPVNSYRYVRIGSTIHLIDDLFSHHLLAPAEAYVSHALIPQGNTITGIRAPAWEIQRQTQGWQLSPPSTEVPQETLQTKIDEWQTTWVAGVTHAEGEPTTDTIEISLQEQGSPLRFGLLKNKAQLQLKRMDNGLIYQLPATSSLPLPPATGIH